VKIGEVLSLSPRGTLRRYERLPRIPLTVVQIVQKPGTSAEIATQLAVVGQSDRARTDGERRDHEFEGSDQARTPSFSRTRRSSRARAEIRFNSGPRAYGGFRPRDEHLRVRQSQKPDRDLLEFLHGLNLELQVAWWVACNARGLETKRSICIHVKKNLTSRPGAPVPAESARASHTVH
jgi:hypothetical protein